MSSLQAASVIESVVREGIPSAETVVVEMADGGEGTARLVAGESGRRCSIAGFDCYGRRAEIEFYESADRSRAYMDSAAAVGLTMLAVRQRNAWTATTRYLGAAVKRLLSVYDQVTLCVGGTATADGGAGILSVFGVRYIDRNGMVMNRVTPTDFINIGRIDFGCMAPPSVLSDHLSVLLDVDVPLLPLDGEPLSSLSFVGQKGIIKRDLVKYTKALRHYVSLMKEVCNPVLGLKYQFSGAGGGLAFPLLSVFGCHAAMGAEVLSGRVFELVKPDRPTFVITGEGSVDSQSFGGKVVGTLIDKSLSFGVSPIVIGGVVEPGLTVPENVPVIATVEKPGSRLPTLKEAKRRLEIAARRVIPLINRSLNDK